jgi:ABC-2 type transport system ATP-binding protein
VGITSVAVSRPTLDDVFMRYTGSTIRDAEATPDRERTAMQVFSKASR